ncbi:MAG: hypothetical protein H6645_13560 [Caldilineaceae bacterium]|nr:hypothetical protein [Caldilineaceae bacterium]
MPEESGSPSEQINAGYNFFDPDLWLARVDGMVWLLRMTYDVIANTLDRLDGMTIRRCTQLLHGIGAGDFEHFVDAFEREPKELTYTELIAQIKKAEEVTDSAASLLASYLVSLLNRPELPSSAPEPHWAVDFPFELKQLLNLRTLCLMYIYFFTDMRELIVASFADHKTAQNHPPLHIIRACTDHLAHDFEILQRAILQRQPIMNTKGEWAAGVLAKELIITDKLAMKALAPLGHLLSNPTILTFFSRETHIRHLPFSNRYIVVGLSHARVSTTYNEQHRTANKQQNLPAFELLAIPHEIGHYLYQQTQLSEDTGADGQTVQNNYPQWHEELFADLYGCLVAGPLAVLGMQALLATSDADELWLDDDAHPTPVVRPFILAEMLRVLGAKEAELAAAANLPNPERYRFAKAADSLDANWTAILRQWQLEPQNVRNGRPAQVKSSALGQEMNVAEKVKALTPVLEQFATRLLQNANFDLWPTDDNNALSAAIPWVQEDYARLQLYGDAIVELMGGEFAGKRVHDHDLIKPNFWNNEWRSIFQGATADAKLQNWLDNWGDSGPRTIGGH